MDQGYRAYRRALSHNDVPLLPPSQVVFGRYSFYRRKILTRAGENKTPAPLPEKQSLLLNQQWSKFIKQLDAAAIKVLTVFINQHKSPTGQEQAITLKLIVYQDLLPATCIFHQAAEINMRPWTLLILLSH